MTLRSARWVLVVVLGLGAAMGCDPKETSSAGEAESKKKPRKKATAPSGEAAASGAASLPGPKPGAEPAAPTDSSAWTFVRQRPEERVGVDACAYLGGLGMACLEALIAQTDPVERRYMRRLSDADARIGQDAIDRGEPGGVAHAEAAMFCAESGACKQKDEDGNELDDGYACLTKAEAALQQKESYSAAHQRACQCDPVRAQIPVMGGTLACDGPNKPVSRGKTIASLDEAKAIRDCAECEPTRGPAACAAEIDRLRATDAEVADYVVKKHVPRCQRN